MTKKLVYLELVLFLIFLSNSVGLDFGGTSRAKRFDEPVQALQNGRWAKRRQARNHQVGQHFDVVVVFEAQFDVVEEFENIESVQARVEKRVHALEGGLAQVQSVVDRVLKRTHFHLTHQLFLYIN